LSHERVFEFQQLLINLASKGC